MDRRNFLRDICLVIFAFLFGYSVKKIDNSMILQKADLSRDGDENKKLILDEIRLLNDSSVEVVNAKRKFGAVGDGKTDDYIAISKAINYAKKHHMSLYIPSGRYYCSQNINIEDVPHIIIDGSIILDEGKALNIAYDAYSAPANWKIFNVEGGKLVLSGLNSSRVEILKARELVLFAHGDIKKKEFIAYNTFMLGKVDTLRIFSEGNNEGWINENKFYSGRIKYIEIGGNYHHNNNIFYGTMLEEFTLNLNMGSSNSFYDVRLEGKNSITFGPGTSDNVIYRSWQGNQYSYLRDSENTNYTNKGFNNQIVSNLDTFHRKESIFHIDSKTDNYELSTLIRNKDDLSIVRSRSLLLETDLIELRNPFGLNLRSDKSLFIIELYAYDADKKLILTKQENFTSLPGGKFNSLTGAYSFGENVGIKNTGIPLFPNEIVKYIRYRVYTGNETEGQVFNYLNVIKVEPTMYNTPIKISSRFKKWTHKEMPSAGYWEAGDIVWNVGGDKNVLLWKRLTTGKGHLLERDWMEK